MGAEILFKNSELIIVPDSRKGLSVTTYLSF